MSTLMERMYRAANAGGCSFRILLLSVMTATVPNFPNVYSALIDGGVPNYDVCGTCPVALCLDRFYLNTASRSASSQYYGGSLLWYSAALVALTRVPFRSSAMPFCCDWYGTVGFRSYPLTVVVHLRLLADVFASVVRCQYLWRLFVDFNEFHRIPYMFGDIFPCICKVYKGIS